MNAPARRGRDGASTRARIEAEALRLFARKGVDATSVRDIAQAAGVAEGALYRHFPSKEALARALFLAHYADLASAIASVRSEAPDFAGRMRALVRRACRLFDGDPELFTYLLIAQHDHLAHVPPDEAHNAVEALAGLVREAVAAGELPEQDVTLAAAMALGAVVQPAVFGLYGRLQGPLERHAERIAAGALAAAGHKAGA
ncbi:MAG TPA: helix-turn-helix domain-containing protein [Xanthobacteraceae bacterium]|nr:helix-turn-helix domain-containing protein [Xanthobacteraceae bacterium]